MAADTLMTFYKGYGLTQIKLATGFRYPANHHNIIPLVYRRVPKWDK